MRNAEWPARSSGGCCSIVVHEWFSCFTYFHLLTSTIYSQIWLKKMPPNQTTPFNRSRRDDGRTTTGPSHPLPPKQGKPRTKTTRSELCASVSFVLQWPEWHRLDSSASSDAISTLQTCYIPSVSENIETKEQTLN